MMLVRLTLFKKRTKHLPFIELNKHQQPIHYSVITNNFQSTLLATLSTSWPMYQKYAPDFKRSRAFAANIYLSKLYHVLLFIWKRPQAVLRRCNLVFKTELQAHSYSISLVTANCISLRKLISDVYYELYLCVPVTIMWSVLFLLMQLHHMAISSLPFQLICSVFQLLEVRICLSSAGTDILTVKYYEGSAAFKDWNWILESFIFEISQSAISDISLYRRS